MAIKEVRFNFYHHESARELNLSIGQPFTWFMDGLMRGRFKLYSGHEVKGVNIVNINLSPSKFSNSHEWYTIGNTHQVEVNLDLRKFKGNRQKRVQTAIICFCELAKKSPLPQVQLLREQALEFKTSERVADAIKASDAYLQQVYEIHLQKT